MSTTNIASEIPLDANTARAVEQLVRMAQNGVRHRLCIDFTLTDGQLGVSVSLERKSFRRWSATRPAIWIPLHAYNAPLLHLLVHIAEHGRLPDHLTTEGDSPRE